MAFDQEPDHLTATSPIQRQSGHTSEQRHGGEPSDTVGTMISGDEALRRIREIRITVLGSEWLGRLLSIRQRILAEIGETDGAGALSHGHRLERFRRDLW